MPVLVGPSFLQTKVAIEARAAALAARLADPRIVRIIGLQADTRNIESFAAAVSGR